MRDRIAGLTQSFTAWLQPRAVIASQRSAQTWAWLSLWAGRGWRVTVRFARWSYVMGRRGFLAALRVTEATLLSARGREWVHATSVFALIFAFAVSSVDMLVTGGPELIGSARAANVPTARVDLIAASSLPREEVEMVFEDVVITPDPDAPPMMMLAEATPAITEPVAELNGEAGKTGDETGEAASAAEEKAKGEEDQA